MKNVPAEKIKKRPRGRPPKQPLTSENIEANIKTRSNTGSQLLNPSNITPDKYAKEEMKKQEAISSFFTPRKIASRNPIHITQEGEILPIPPTENKPSRLSIPSRTRAKSDNGLAFR